MVMTIDDKHIQQIEELINEGISCQTSALEGKKYFIKKLQDWLGNICKERQEEIPFWVYKLSIPKIYVGREIRSEDEEKFYSESISLSLQELRRVQSNYEMHKRIDSDQRQIKYMRHSLLLSIIAIIIATFIPLFTAICCTTTTKLEEGQFQELKTAVSSFNYAGETLKRRIK